MFFTVITQFFEEISQYFPAFLAQNIPKNLRFAGKTLHKQVQNAAASAHDLVPRPIKNFPHPPVDDRPRAHGTGL